MVFHQHKHPFSHGFFYFIEMCIVKCNFCFISINFWHKKIKQKTAHTQLDARNNDETEEKKNNSSHTINHCATVQIAIPEWASPKLSWHFCFTPYGPYHFVEIHRFFEIAKMINSLNNCRNFQLNVVKFGGCTAIWTRLFLIFEIKWISNEEYLAT